MITKNTVINWVVVLISASIFMTVSALDNPFDNIHYSNTQAPHINLNDDFDRFPSIPKFNSHFYRPNVNFDDEFNRIPSVPRYRRHPHINLRDDYNQLPNFPKYRNPHSNFRYSRFRHPIMNINSNNYDNDEYYNPQNYPAHKINYRNINNNNNYRNGLNPINNNINNNPNGFNNNQPHINHIQREKCQPERLEHQVIMKRHNDGYGRWIIYTQIVETRNVGHHCHNNEFVYLAHQQKAGWLWNTHIKSLVHYSLGEPKFITRPVRNPLKSNSNILVNMSRNYAPATVDLDQAFPKRLAIELVTVGADDVKWSELAKQFLPILKTNTAYFEMVKRTENSGAEQIKMLSETQSNREVLE